MSVYVTLPTSLVNDIIDALQCAGLPGSASRAEDVLENLEVYLTEQQPCQYSDVISDGGFDPRYRNV